MIALTGFAQNIKALRVCADPNDMPLSNEAGQGLENKLAQLLADKLGTTVEYAWWSERKSFAKNPMNEGKCDVLMGVPSAIEEVSVTRPYYRSSYVFVSRSDRDLRIASLADERLAQLRIGINVVGDDYAPPSFALASRGITKNIVGFSLLGAPGETDGGRKIIDAVARGDIDVAIVWGPVGGYYARMSKVPLAVQPVSPSTYAGIPFTFDISMGVRKGDEGLRKTLDGILQSDSAAVQQIVSEYGVPQVH
ncbi:MAG: quinoprotein dehydrogenase-associated putative ABC transporter substrate-binding protein [Acidobacteriota bacterium]|nr:quinoprotein dehydrogenase-associated putative ABC transporter substrate-binding protein [Acidobacteriota bacterium]